MKIHHIEAVHGNFGDELNRWLWPAVLPGMWDQDAEVLFVGIGTILDKNLPAAGTSIVFGTGAGYTAPPPDIASGAARWRLYGVRGPLTARALGLDPRLAMTDPAILLATLEEFRGRPRGAVLFVPHWKSVRYGRWQRICECLGIEFVDPCTESTEVVRRIASAKKVIAESMHAAIIADAFRVPWLPVALSREISPFKWMDWAASLEVPYRPECLPASNHIELLRNRLLRWSVHSNVADYPSPVAVTRGHRMSFDDLDELMTEFEIIGRRIGERWRWNASIGLEILMKRLARLGLRPEPARGFGDSERMRDVATVRLATVLESPGYLSGDAAHRRALDRTLTQLAQFERDWRARALTPRRASL